MIFVQSVRSNLKGGCATQLGPKTVLVGPNGGGKSTIVQSVELASCGHASDSEGRSQVKQLGALGRLFPANEEHLYAECTLSDGSTLSWETQRKKDGGLKEPTHKAPIKIRWPVQEIKAVLSGDGNTVSAWLEQQVMEGFTLDNLLSLLPPEVHEAVRGLVKRSSSRLDVLSLSKDARDEARNLRLQATRAEKTVEQMLVGVQPPLSDERREALAEELRQLLAAQGVGVTAEQLDRMRADLSSLVDQYKQRYEHLQHLPRVTQEIGAALVKLDAAYQLSTAHCHRFPDEGCWVCGVGTAEQVKGQNTTLRSIQQDLASAHADGTRRQELLSKLSELDREIRTLATQIESTPVRANIEADVDRLRGTLAADDAARRSWKNASGLRLEIAQARAKADHLTTAAKSLAEAGKTLLDQRKQAFESAVSTFLPEGEDIEIDLASARVGLVRGEELHSALSGSEWSRVLMALASATAVDGAPCILAPDDRAWDAETLAQAMEALTRSPGQILIMSTVEPRPVDGWACVHVMPGATGRGGLDGHRDEASARASQRGP